MALIRMGILLFAQIVVDTIEDSEPTSSSEAPPEPEADETDEDNNQESQEETETPETCEDEEVAINSALNDELQEIHQTGDDRAELIIDLRESQEFESYSDFERIDGIGPAYADEIEDQGIICFD